MTRKIVKRSTFFAPDHLKVWPTVGPGAQRALGQNLTFDQSPGNYKDFFFGSPFKRPPIELSPLPSANQLSEE